MTLEDANGGKYEGYRTHYKWDNGLALRDWRYVVRIANIDVSNLSEPSSAANIAKLMVKALHRIPNRGMGRPVFYMNRTVGRALDLQSLEKTSLAISVKRLKASGGLHSVVYQSVKLMRFWKQKPAWCNACY